MREQAASVMEKLIRQCRQAYQARTPLIFVDTEEIGLMQRLARESALVELVEEKRVYGEKYRPYYAYVGSEPDALDRCVNFSRDVERLKQIGKANGDLDAQEPAQLVLLHLTRENQTKKKDSLSTQYAAALREYVERYVCCRDNHCALRSSCVLLYGDVSLLPKDLQIYTKILRVEYPQTWEIAQLVTRLAQEQGKPYEDEADACQAALEMNGFGLMQAERNINALLWSDEEDGKTLLFDPVRRKQIVLEEKKQVLLQGDEILTLCSGADDTPSVNELGGMGQYKKWIDRQRIRMLRADFFAREYGITAPKGVLLCGVRGCGKSEAAKILQRQWEGIPMVRMDIDRLMGGLVGDSERNMRRALEQVEAMAPVILWIDELDKGISGASSRNQDNATFKRMFGRLLTWMQEKTKPVFIFATANDISQLPQELFRKGRFDEVFSLFMPTWAECVEIFKKLLQCPDEVRQAAARRLKDGRPLTPRFQMGEGGCDSDSVIGQIMDMLLQGTDIDQPAGAKFVTGSDIQFIINSALARLAPEELDEPIRSGRWLEVVRETINDPTTGTTGGSSASLDDIAATYVRLLRGNFVPTADQSSQLFQSEHYRVKWDPDKGVRQVEYTGPDQFEHKYDQALFNALKPRILEIGYALENKALDRLSD